MDLRALSPEKAGLSASFAAALDWWREAGVDADFTDEPAAWLKPPEDETPEPVPPQPAYAPERATTAAQRALAPNSSPAIGGGKDGWPQELTAFHDFWMHEPSLEPGAPADRVAPRGQPGAPLMVVVGQPEEGDNEVLLSGSEGRMLAAILRAGGLAEDAVYCASALPRATPMPDWGALAATGLGALTRHHIALVRPERLIVFGRGLAPLFDASAGAQQLQLGSSSLPMLLAPALATLGRSAGQRKRFWNNWLEWTR